ncbi:hypothetical protein Pla52n_66690 [Stieleria varia]|uniref:Uncharacterized protein n=2 Tax=Stieleria varia TaxID=2528005 RepID=A0A5C5ZW64_9BACT|nr:hypothetical protein Pla52n_66690 [Stieleria varia]
MRAKIMPLAFVALFVFGMVSSYGRSKAIGTKLKITEKETVSYSGDATETDAGTLGKRLVELDYFDGQGDADVLLSKNDSGFTVSFVLQDGAWESASTVTSFASLGRQLHQILGGRPLTVNLIDSDINVRRSLSITQSESVLAASECESIRYLSPATEAQADLLADAFKKVGFFDGNNPKDVFLEIGSDSETQIISAVVQEGVWNDPEMVASFDALFAGLAGIINAPIEYRLIDKSNNLHHSNSFAE